MPDNDFDKKLKHLLRSYPKVSIPFLQCKLGITHQEAVKIIDNIHHYIRRPTKKQLVIKDFVDAVKGTVDYWDSNRRGTKKEKLQGLACSILAILDGKNVLFDGDIHDIAKAARGKKIFDYY